MLDLLWLTDIHLDHIQGPIGLPDILLTHEEKWARQIELVKKFSTSLLKHPNFSKVLITGDIAESQSIVRLLRAFCKPLKDIPVYFIEGNHDYYNASFTKVHNSLNKVKFATWLSKQAKPIFLDEKTALVGTYATFDGIYGAPTKSDIVLWDFSNVKDFSANFNEITWDTLRSYGGRNELLRLFRVMAQTATDKIRPVLVEALNQRANVIFATHVPPFKGACWHEGKISNEHWMPWFTCAAMGNMLESMAQEYPENKILVVCGHTHSQGVYRHSENLKVFTGAARYGYPAPAGLLQDPFSEENWKS